MEYKYDISFISINYNGFKDTCELIDSIKRVVHKVSFEILIVDNQSREDEATALSSRYPDIVVIASKKNLGFAGGNNVAIPQAQGRYLFFINNDTLLEEDNLDSLISRIESKKNIGMVCPKLRFTWGSRQIQFAGFTPLSKITLRNYGIGCGEEEAGQYNQAHATPFAHGAAMMVKHEVIEKAGMMWDGYFLYYEEMDWSEHIIKAGYEIWYEPAQTIFHKESKSVGADSPMKVYYLTRNRLLFAKRNREGFSRLLCYCYLTFVALNIHVPKYLVKGKTKQCKSVLRGIKDFYFRHQTSSHIQ